MSLALVLILATLASARTFRLLQVDGAGQPFRRFMDILVWRVNPKEARLSYGRPPRRKDVSRSVWRRHRIAMSLAEGAGCGFCIGYWLSLAWVGTGLAWGDTWQWQLAAGAFAVNYVAGHLGAHLETEHADDDN